MSLYISFRITFPRPVAWGGVPAQMVTRLLVAHASLYPGPIPSAGSATGVCIPKAEGT